MDNIKNLLNLIKENPDLPILPWVDYEIVGGDSSSRWLGSFGNSYVGEYAMCEDRYFEDREDFKEYYFDYHDDELCEKFNYKPEINEYSVKNNKYTKEQLDENDKNEQILNEYLDKVADEYFTKAILVDIDLAD